MQSLQAADVELMLRQAEATGEAFLDALADEVGVVDGSGQIIAVNEAWRRFAINNGDEFLAHTGVGQNYLDVCRASAAAGEGDAEQALIGLTAVLRGTTEYFSLEYEMSDANQRRWFLLTATSLANLPGALVSHREITERRKAQEALRLSGEIQGIGPVFESVLPALAKNLAVALSVEHAFLTEFVDPVRGRVQLLTHWAGTGYGDLFTYETASTPCENVLEGRTVVFPSGVQKVFPDDEWLKEISAESYIAVPLIGSDAKVLGHLGVIDTKPLSDAGFAETTLKVFASRATPELERRKTERRLADQSRLIDNAPDAIVGIDENFVVTHWNKAAEKMYGWEADEVIGLDVGSAFQTQISEEERSATRRLLQEAGELRGEYVQRRKDGSEVQIDATSIAYRGPDGRISGYISINRDITEQKRAEQALKRAERTNEAILDAIPDMIFTLDGDGRFLSFRPAQNVEPLVPPSSFLGRHVEDVMPPDLASTIMATIRACLRSGQGQTLPYQLVEEGSLKDYEARVLPIGPDEVVAIVRDDTDQRRREAAAREERLMAAEAYLTTHAPGRHRDKAVMLIADRDVRTLRFLRRFLEHAGHRPIVTSDPAEALRLAELETPDLILLDITFPDAGGVDLFRELRPLSQAPIVLLIPAEREEEAVDALRMGADDYIKKPISPSELTARTEAAFRRRSVYEVPRRERLELGELAIDYAARLVTVGGEVVTLTPTEFNLLSELAVSAGRVLTHDEILERVWGEGYVGNHDLLRSFVRSLRRKLGDDPNQPKFLRSERGVGYRVVRPSNGLTPSL